MNLSSNREQGVNNDSWVVWRNSGEIGWVHLAFSIIILSIKDYFFGDVDEIMSSCLFFEGDPEHSTYPYWCQVLGIDPDDNNLIDVIREHQLTGQRPEQSYFEELDRLYNFMTIDRKS